MKRNINFNTITFHELFTRWIAGMDGWDDEY
jgi:hypothetical protein